MKNANADQAGRLSERSRLQIDRLPLAYIHMAADGTVLDWNPAAEKTFGYSREDSLGCKCLDLIVPDPADDQIQEIVRRLGAGDMDAHSVNENRTKDGRIITCQWFNTPLKEPDGKFAGVISLAQDISERKQTDEQLKRSEFLLAEAQQLAQIGNWNWDVANNTLYWSDEKYRIFGLNPQESVMTYHRFLSLVHPEDREIVQRIVEQALTDRGSLDYRFRALHTDGTVRLVQCRGRVVSDKAGTAVRMFGTVQDITERRKTDDALQEHASRLQALSHRLVEVQEEERRHLARELHDEVGQLLTALRLLLKPSGDLASKAEDLRLLQARGIIDELIAKVRGLSFDLRPAVLDQLGLVAALLALFELYTERTGVSVSFKHNGVAGRFVPVLETTVYRIVQEALTNVARHAGVAGVIVRVWATADMLSAQIEDNGRGFDLNAMRAAPRSGGLTGMEERVMLVRGELTIESSPETGTQITAHLPLR